MDAIVEAQTAPARVAVAMARGMSMAAPEGDDAAASALESERLAIIDDLLLHGEEAVVHVEQRLDALALRRSESDRAKADAAADAMRDGAEETKGGGDGDDDGDDKPKRRALGRITGGAGTGGAGVGGAGGPLGGVGANNAARPSAGGKLGSRLTSTSEALEASLGGESALGGGALPTEKSAHTGLAGDRFRDLYRIGRQIGQGSYSTVYFGLKKATNEVVAVKVVPKDRVKQQEEEQLRGEVAVLTQLRHPNIVQLLDFFDEEAAFFIVMEFVSGGDLFDQILQMHHYCEADANRIVHTVRALPALSPPLRCAAVR